MSLQLLLSFRLFKLLQNSRKKPFVNGSWAMRTDEKATVREMVFFVKGNAR